MALAQAHKVASALEVANRWPADHIQIQVVETTGDRVQDRPLAEIGGKQLWTKELDRALIEKEVDFCVHSLKDVETWPIHRSDVRFVSENSIVLNRSVLSAFTRLRKSKAAPRNAFA